MYPPDIQRGQIRGGKFVTYQIVMLNKLVLADYHVPTKTTGEGFEFLIVERTSDVGELLLITEAGRALGNEKEAPAMLTRGNTLIGTLIRIEDDGQSETFIFNRSLPVGGAFAGRFFPGDGTVEMRQTNAGFSLKASGRHAHAATPDPVTGQLIHSPEPIAPAMPGSLTWLFDAVEIPQMRPEDS